MTLFLLSSVGALWMPPWGRRMLSISRNSTFSSGMNELTCNWTYLDFSKLYSAGSCSSDSRSYVCHIMPLSSYLCHSIGSLWDNKEVRARPHILYNPYKTGGTDCYAEPGPHWGTDCYAEPDPHCEKTREWRDWSCWCHRPSKQCTLYCCAVLPVSARG